MFLRKYILPLLFVCLSTLKIQASNDTIKCKLWVDSVFATMTPDERIGQLFVVNIPAQTNSQNLRKLVLAIKEQHIGGILFWDGSIKDQAELTNFAQATSKIPLMITLDGEWGLAMRLKNGLRYPKKTSLSALTDENLIYEFGAEIGRQCNELRINVNLDPVLDVNLNSDNPVINTRSFGDNAQDISRKASLFIKGLKSKGVFAVGKHFPGHGDTFQDSHHELAIVTHDSTQLKQVDLVPYRELINKGLSGIMVGHIAVPAIDSSGTPASLSPLIITNLLKTSMHFDGLVFTDALKMKGVSDQPNLSVRALLAGNDILLDPMYVEKEFEALQKAVRDSMISMELIDQKCKKILRFKYLFGLNHYKPIELYGLEERINTPEAILLQQKMAKQSATVLKYNPEYIPINGLNDNKIAIVSVGASDNTTFIQTASLYTKTTNYALAASDPLDSIKSLITKLDSVDLVILSIHTQLPDSIIAQICARRKTALVFFISPYLLKNYSLSIEKAEVVVLGYENLIMMQQACAQVLFGGLRAQGKLPINIPNLSERGDGVDTKKTRLGYDVPESVGLNSRILQEIDSIANNAIEYGAMPGCQILVAKKGTVVYHKSFGHQDYTKQVPIRNTDIYDLASVTKIAATLPIIMKLDDDKKIDIYRKLSFYLPELRKSNKKNITIYDLLTHQAGLKPFIPFYEEAIDMQSVDRKLMQNKLDTTYNLQVDQKLYANRNYKYKAGLITKVPDSTHTLQIADSMFILNTYNDSIWQQIIDSPISEPGKYVYSDLSFLMLQRLIEHVTKKSLDELSESYFYNDLGAYRTTFNPLKSIPKIDIVPTACDSFLRKQLLVGYVHDQNAAFMGGVAGHAGLFSNCNDLAKLYQMILNGGTYGGKKYLSTETCTYFTTQKCEVSRRGIGFDRSETGSQVLVGHTGFTGTCVWVDPKEEIIYIFLSNRIHPDSWNKKLMQLNVRTNIETIIYKAIIK